MNSKLMLLAVIAGVVVAGCAQETGAPTGESATESAAQAESRADAATDTAAAQADAAAAGAEFTALLAKADPQLGKRQFIYCQACHTVKSGGPNKVGPNLAGIVDSPAGESSGFRYSAALTDANIVWDTATLDRWLHGPATLVPGTTMVFAGIKDPAQRANLIAYLQQLPE